MSKPTAKFVVTNDYKSSRVVYVEPWGEDYTLSAGESIEVIAVDNASAPWFNVIESDKGTLLYIEGGASDFMVYQGETRLQCGHNRGL